MLEADPVAWRLILERLMDETEDNLESVSSIEGPERAQVVADVEADLDRLEAAYDLLIGSTRTGSEVLIPTADPTGEIRLQASWENGSIVVWAGGPDMVAHTNADLADRLEALGGPSLGWAVHADVTLPNGLRAAALSIPVEEALGWLVVAVGGGQGDEDGVGASVRWLGRVAVAAVGLVAKGRIVPSLRTQRHSEGKVMDLNVRWSPARVDDGDISRLAGAMPGPVAVLSRKDPRTVTLEVIGAVVDAIALEAGEKLERPATPPVIRNAADVGEAFVARLDGSPFRAPIPAGAEVSKRLDQWAQPGERGGQDHARRPARPARPRRRLVPVGARPGRRGRPACPSSRPSPTASARSTSPTRSSGSSGSTTSSVVRAVSGGARCTSARTRRGSS